MSEIKIMSEIKLSLSRIGKKIKLAYGVEALFHKGVAESGDEAYFLLSNFWKLDGSPCKNIPSGYSCSWIHSEKTPEYVVFSDPFSDIFINPAVYEKTQLHIKRAGAKDLAGLLKIRAERKLVVDMLSPEVKRYSRCCYTNKPILKSKSIATHHGDCSIELKDKIVTCSVSGGIFVPLEGNHLVYDGIGYVLNEYAKNVYKCSETDVWFISTSSPKKINTGDGDRIVSGSVYRQYHKCPKCGIWYKGDGHEIYGGEMVCSACIVNARRCADCGVYFFSDDECTICDSCVGEPIKSYSTKFKNLPDYGNKLMFGVEIEFEIDESRNRSDIALKFKRKFGSDIMIKSDGSLDYGFEVVTKPMIFTDAIKIVHDICEFSRDKCLQSPDTTGIHVHVSRAGLKNSEIVNMIAIFSELERDVAKIARRSSDRWANVYKCKIKEITSQSQMLEEQRDTRYRAINLCNSGTVEFRVFKGTTNKQTAVNYLLFVSAIVEAAKKLTVDDFDSLDMNKVLSYVSGKDLYSSLFEYARKVKCIN